MLPRPVVAWLRERKGSTIAKPEDAAASRMGLPEFGPSVEHMIELEDSLWSTGDTIYAEKLTRAVGLTKRASRPRAHGSLALARWHFYQGNTDTALQCLEDVRPSDPILRAELDLFRADCHCAQGQGQPALTILSRMTGRYTADQNVLLRVGHARSLLGKTSDHGSGPMTEGLNAIYSRAGVGMIRRRSVNDPIGLDNLSCDVAKAEPAESLPLVTVLVRFPDSLPDVHGGMSSLLDQSWRNLEILVPGGQEARDRLAALDPEALEDDRVVLIEERDDTDHPLALGATHANGELLTTHLYGSWAHPQRIEAQATALLVGPSLGAAVSLHMNVDSDLDPRPLAITPRMSLVGPDRRSTMIRTTGLTPSQVIAAYDRVVAGYSPVTGGLEPPEEITVLNNGVPLTLTLASAWPVATSTSAVSL